jgi:hypothetical protein
MCNPIEIRPYMTYDLRLALTAKTIVYDKLLCRHLELCQTSLHHCLIGLNSMVRTQPSESRNNTKTHRCWDMLSFLKQNRQNHFP